MLKQLPMTVRLNNVGSVNRNLQRSEKLLEQNQRQASVLKTHTPACFCSAFKELAFDSLSFSETIASWWSGFATAWLTLLVFVMLYARLMTLYLHFCQLSVIRHILTNQVLRCWADGGFEKLKRVCRRFFLVSPSSLLGHTAIPLFCVRDD